MNFLGKVWGIDIDVVVVCGVFFLPGMFAMFKKVAAKERICGFYSTGPKIRENDLAIAELFK